MGGFLNWLFGAKEQVAVEAEKAAPLVDPSPALPVVDIAPDGEGAVGGTGPLIPSMFVGVREFRELVRRLEVVERRLYQNEREVTVLQARMESVERRLLEMGAMVEEWRGE